MVRISYRICLDKNPVRMVILYIIAIMIDTISFIYQVNFFFKAVEHIISLCQNDIMGPLVTSE